MWFTVVNTYLLRNTESSSFLTSENVCLFVIIIKSMYFWYRKELCQYTPLNYSSKNCRNQYSILPIFLTLVFFYVKYKILLLSFLRRNLLGNDGFPKGLVIKKWLVNQPFCGILAEYCFWILYKQKHTKNHGTIILCFE